MDSCLLIDAFFLPKAQNYVPRYDNAFHHILKTFITLSSSVTSVVMCGFISTSEKVILSASIKLEHSGSITCTTNCNVSCIIKKGNKLGNRLATQQAGS